MKTLLFLVVASFMFTWPLQGQDKLVLLNGDTLTVKVKKISGSAITVETEGLEQEINLQFISKGFLASGKEIPMKGYYFKEYSTMEDGHTEMPKYSVELEQEADNLFAKERKFRMGRPPGELNIIDITYEKKVQWHCYGMNAFLGFDTGEELIFYVKTIPEIKRYGSYKLESVSTLSLKMGMGLRMKERHWTALITDKEFIVDGGTKGVTHTFSDGVWTFMNPKMKGPDIYQITYMTEDEIRYVHFPSGDLLVKNIKRLPDTEASIKK